MDYHHHQLDLEWQLLVAAREDRCMDVVRHLIGIERVNPNAANIDGMTPLHFASRHGSIAVARYLIEEVGVDLKKRSFGGYTALHWACESNRLLMVHLLVEAIGVGSVDARDHDGDTPLHIAASCDFTDIVMYLVEHWKANVNAKNRDGNTPLDEAIIFFSDLNEDIVRFLLPRTSSISDAALIRIWELERLRDLRGLMVLEMYAIGRGLQDAFHRYPIHTIFEYFPLPSSEAFQECIHLFPPFMLYILDDHGRLLIHVALSSPYPAAKSLPIIAFLYEREPRSALAKDPITGLYPHEFIAGLVTDDGGNRSYNYSYYWLDLLYQMFRSNPLQRSSPPPPPSSVLCRRASF